MAKGLHTVGSDAIQILLVFVMKTTLKSMIFDETHALKGVVGASNAQKLAVRVAKRSKQEDPEITR